MSLVAPSDAPAVPTNGQSKRSRTCRAPSTSEGARPSSTPTKQPPVLQTPLAAALALGMSHVATLHKEAQPFLQELIKQVLGEFATHYWKQKKYREMVANTSYVPASCKIGLTLNAVSEVKKSEDFIALNAQLDAEIAKTQRAFAGYALRAYNMTQHAHHQRFRKKFAQLLPAAARIFGAELCLSAYREHQGVLDLLATHQDVVLSPLNITNVDFLVLYREVNELAHIPSPTVPNNIDHVIAAMNGPRPGEGSLPQPPPQPLLVDSPDLGEGMARAQMPTAHVFQANNSPDVEQVVANAATATATATAAAAITGPTDADAAAAAYAERSAMAPAVQPAAAPPSLPTNTTPRSAIRNPYARETPAASLPRPVQFEPRITLARDTSVSFRNESEDAVMGVENDPEIIADQVIVGGKGVLIQMLLDLVVKAVHEPMELFDTQVKLSEKSKRIKKATLRPQLDDTAERIANVVNAERPVAPATLRGLVREEAVSTTSALEREVQSLKAQMENLLVAKAGKKKNNQATSSKKLPATRTNQATKAPAKNGKQHTPAKNSRGAGNGKAGTKRHANQQAGERGRDTTTVSRNKRANPSKSKSNGKKPATNKKKRS